MEVSTLKTKKLKTQQGQKVRKSLNSTRQRILSHLETYFYDYLLGIVRRRNHKDAAEEKVQLNPDHEHGPNQNRQTVLFDCRAEEATRDETEYLQPQTN